MTRTVPRRSIATALRWSAPLAALAAPAPAAAPQELLGYFVDDRAHLLVVVNPTRSRIRLRLVVNHVRFPEPALAAPYRIAGVEGRLGEALDRDVVSYDLGAVQVPARGSWVGTIALVHGPHGASFLPSPSSFGHGMLLTADLPLGAGAPLTAQGPTVSTAYLTR